MKSNEHKLSFLSRFHMQFFMHFLGCGYFTLPGDQIQNLLRKKRLKKYVFFALNSSFRFACILFHLYKCIPFFFFQFLD
jgi:hypothetical protein